MTLAERTAALIGTVDQYRAERCAELLEPAVREARTTVKGALSDARRRVTTAIDEERKRLRRDVGAVEASLATERRLVAQQRAVRQLSRAWTALREALTKRWYDPTARRAWVEAHLARATECLAHDAEWKIRHHAAWRDDERRTAAELLRTRGIRAMFEHDAALVAGFVVTCGHNVLDASLDGLLADRSGIEGRLLQRMEDVPR
ncbi:MAG: hypothetical protein ACXW2G_04485 [Burkholderiaceae bacterium]